MGCAPLTCDARSRPCPSPSNRLSGTRAAGTSAAIFPTAFVSLLLTKQCRRLIIVVSLGREIPAERLRVDRLPHLSDGVLEIPAEVRQPTEHGRFGHLSTRRSKVQRIAQQRRSVLGAAEILLQR